jgi:HAD superfamily hydrolase (TIGR01458 family)
MRDIRGLLIDLDGTVYEGEDAVPGAAEALAELGRRGVPHLFTTTTSRMSRRAVAETLSDMGVAIEAERVLTAPMAAALWLERERVSTILALLPESTLEDLAGVDLVGASEAPEAVVVGDLGPAFTFARLNEAFRALRAGARLVAIHKNRFWLPEAGPTLDAGPFVVGLEYAADVEAVLVGKPSATFFELATERLGVPREAVAVVGDDPESDVRGARAAGLLSIQVGTGKGRGREAPGPGAGPDLRAGSIADLPGMLRSPRDGGPAGRV